MQLSWQVVWKYENEGDQWFTWKFTHLKLHLEDQWRNGCTWKTSKWLYFYIWKRLVTQAHTICWLGSCDSWQHCSVEKPVFAFGRINTQLSISGKACEQAVIVASPELTSLILRPSHGLELWKFHRSTTFSFLLTPNQPGLHLKAIKAFFPGSSCLSTQLSSFPYLFILFYFIFLPATSVQSILSTFNSE